MLSRTNQQFIIIVLIFAVCAFAYYVYLLEPLDRKYYDSASTFKQMESRLSDFRMRVQELPKIKAQTDSLLAEVNELGKLLPKEEEIPALLRAITNKAQKYGLQLDSLAPAKLTPQQNYKEIPFQVNLRGRYNSVGSFLADIGQESRIIGARDLNMIYSVSGNKNDQSNITADFTLLSYSCNE